MEYRRANRGDIERFVENRVEFAASIYPPFRHLIIPAGAGRDK